MSKYKIKLLKKEMVAQDTMAFHFEKPEAFTYTGGQYADFTLINPPETDKEGDKRTFTLASAPFEPQLTIATRLRDTAFKRVLKNLPAGSEVEIEGPYGSFALPREPETPAVFLTGGIGCTVARSMILQAAHDNAPHKLIFLYSNRNSESAAFLAEFTELAARHPRFTFVPTLTDQSAQDWNGEHDEITIEMLQKYVTDITAPIYYLSGSTAMVSAMRTMLLHAGVDKFHIRSDQYVGY